MNVLSVDTSSNSACIGLYQVLDRQMTKVYFNKQWNKKRSHSEVITSYFLQGLEENNISPEEIGLICLGIGPGSFTGIRVALNFAKALAYSYSIDIYTVNSLLPPTMKFKENNNNVIILNNAFRNMVYGLCVTQNTQSQVTQAFSCQPKDIFKFVNTNFLNSNPLLIGDAIALYKDHFPTDFINKCKINTEAMSKNPEDLIRCYLHDKGPELLNWNQVTPLYIRGSEAEEKLLHK